MKWRGVERRLVASVLPTPIGKGCRLMDQKDLVRAGRATLIAAASFLFICVTGGLAYAVGGQVLVTEYELLHIVWKLAATVAGICMSIAAFFVIRWIRRNDQKWEDHYRWKEEKADPVIAVHELLHDYAQRSGKTPVCLALMSEISGHRPTE